MNGKNLEKAVGHLKQFLAHTSSHQEDRLKVATMSLQRDSSMMVLPLQVVVENRGRFDSTDSLLTADGPSLDGNRRYSTHDDGSVRKPLSPNTSTSSNTLKTAEETWLEGFLGGEEDLEVLSPANSFGRTIAPQLPLIPSPKNHRRTASAIPRLQTASGLPPLPPRKNSSELNRRRTSSLEFSNNNVGSSSFKSHKRAHRRTSSASLSSGSSTVEMNKERSMEALKKQLFKMREAFGKQDARVAPVWNMIANHYSSNGDLDSALKSFKKALKCEPGEHLPDSYNGIGSIYWSLGRLEDAVGSFVKALNTLIFTVTQAGKDPNKSLRVARIHEKIALVQTDMGRHDEAFAALMYTHTIRTHVLGANHPDVARALDSMGKIHLKQQNFAAAMVCHKGAQAIWNEVSSKYDKSQGMLSSLQNIAFVHQASGDVDAAIVAFGAVAATQKSMMVSERSSSHMEDFANTLFVLAGLFLKRNMSDKSYACLMEADQLLARTGFSPENATRLKIANRIQSMFR